jgi:hypothetical protein
VATTQHSIRVVKHFTYRGNNAQQWSNRYFFNGGAPADEAAADALMDAWVAIERALYDASVVVVSAHIYAPGSDVAIHNKTYSLAGTLSSPGGATPGDCTINLRMATTKTSTKNHPVYVMSYYHRALKLAADLTGDLADTAQRIAVGTFADVLRLGLTVGGRVYKRTTPDGHLVTGHAVDVYIGHRDFPR